MNDFKERLQKIKDILNNHVLMEMANVGPKFHRFGVDVKLHVMQPGTKSLNHGPRIKVFKQDPEINFSIILSEDPNKVEIASNSGDPGKVLRSESDQKKVVAGVKKYRKAFLKFWNDSSMTTDELRELMDKIDNGEDI